MEVATTFQPVIDGILSCVALLCRSVKKSPAGRYGKPVMIPGSDSIADSDGGDGTTSDGEDAFPPSYVAPLAGLMSKGEHTNKL